MEPNPRSGERCRAISDRRPTRGADLTVSVCLLWAYARHSIPLERALPIFEAEGIDVASLVDHRTRIPSRVSKRLLEMALEERGDPALGLRIALDTQPGAYGMVEHLARSAPTLRESIEVYSRFSALIQESAESKLVEEGATARIVYEAHEPQPRAVTDFALGYALQMMRRHVVGGVDPVEIRLSVAPPAHREVYSELLGIPARFDQPEDAIVIRRDDLSKPMSEAREEVHAALEIRARKAVDRLTRSGSFVARVRICVRTQLARGSVSMEQTAERLRISPTTLRRRLAEEGTSFSEILDAMRSEAARRYVLSSRNELGEITSRLGFSHPNGFYKAFKRWTGLSPREYRARYGER